MQRMEEIRRRLSHHEPKPMGRYRYFSVLVPFVVHQDEICLLYEVRARDLESDPGEICFPGGHVEPGESLLEAALRETEEEIGVPRERIAVLGQGDVLHGYANYSLFTFLAEIDYEDYCRAKIQTSEVDEIFLMPISHLNFEDAQFFHERVCAEIADDFPYDTVGIDEDYRWRNGEWVIPILKVDDRPLWGLTARITHDVLQILAGEGEPSKKRKNNPLKQRIPRALRVLRGRSFGAQERFRMCKEQKEREMNGIQMELDLSLYEEE